MKTIESVIAKIGPKQETTKLKSEINAELAKVLPDHDRVVSLGGLVIRFNGIVGRCLEDTTQSRQGCVTR